MKKKFWIIKGDGSDVLGSGISDRFSLIEMKAVSLSKSRYFRDNIIVSKPS